MLSRRNVLVAAAFALSFVFVLADAIPVHAQSGNRVRLFATMSSGAAKAKAKYELLDGARRKFSIEVQNATPGQVLSISAGGTSVGSLTVDAFGKGKLERDTKLGEAVPVLESGALVEASQGGTSVMSGQLR